MSLFSAPARRRQVCLGLLASLLLSLFITALRDEKLTSSVTQGDFPAFYSAGRLLAEGRAESLYSFAAQQQIQQESWPSLSKEFLGFVYPPFVAQIFSPLAHFSGLSAKYIYLLISLLALTLVAALIKKTFKTVALSPLEIVTLALCFPPALMSIVGGQNSVFSLLIIVLFSAATIRSRTTLAGFYLGLLFFKPNLGLAYLLLGLSLVGPRLLPGAAISLGIYYLSSAALLGFGWPFIWFRAATAFSSLEYVANKHQLLSLSDFALLAWQHSSIVGLVLSLLALGFFSYLLAYRLWTLLKEGPESSVLRVKTIASLPLAVTVFSPHVMFYESLLWLLPFVATDLLQPLFKPKGSAFLFQAILLLGFFGLLMTFKSALPFSALALFNWGLFLRAFWDTQALSALGLKGRQP